MKQWPIFGWYTVFYSIRIFEVYVFLKRIRSKMENKMSVKNVEFSKTQNNKYNEANTPSASEDSRGDRTHDDER